MIEKFMVVGLGNPGSVHKWTRHNVGFEVIGKLAFDHDININQRRNRAAIGSGHIGRRRVWLCMPLTYMNLSGESVRELLRYYDVEISNMIVVYDDISLPVGAIRVREQGGSGGHNGMNNIIYQLNTEDFPRVRVGVGAKPEGWELSKYVLSRFRDDERDGMIRGITAAGDAVYSILTAGIIDAMNKFNGVKKEKDEKEDSG